MDEVLDIEKISSIDALEKLMLDKGEPALEELEHVHTPGLYGRKWSAKAGTFWVTKEHRIKHQFVILDGVISVGIIKPDGGVKWEKEVYETGRNGITNPGTKRVLYLWADTVWMTFHPNPDNLNEVDFVDLVTEKHDNKLFSQEDEGKVKKIRSKIEQKYLTA
jgi:hypothetical protein